MTEATCNKCGRVAFEVTREYAESEVKKFNEFYDGLDAKGKSNYGGPSKVENYEHCIGCGNHYKNFRDTIKGDCPAGCTINPIIIRRD
jgi:sarcosine oxidase delta subunit